MDYFNAKEGQKFSFIMDMCDRNFKETELALEAIRKEQTRRANADPYNYVAKQKARATAADEPEPQDWLPIGDGDKYWRNPLKYQVSVNEVPNEILERYLEAKKNI